MFLVSVTKDVDLKIRDCGVAGSGWGLLAHAWPTVIGGVKPSLT